MVRPRRRHRARQGHRPHRPRPRHRLQGRAGLACRPLRAGSRRGRPDRPPSGAGRRPGEGGRGRAGAVRPRTGPGALARVRRHLTADRALPAPTSTACTSWATATPTPDATPCSCAGTRTGGPWGRVERTVPRQDGSRFTGMAPGSRRTGAGSAWGPSPAPPWSISWNRQSTPFPWRVCARWTARTVSPWSRPPGRRRSRERGSRGLRTPCGGVRLR